MLYDESEASCCGGCIYNVIYSTDTKAAVCIIRRVGIKLDIERLDDLHKDRQVRRTKSKPHVLLLLLTNRRKWIHDIPVPIIFIHYIGSRSS